MSRIYCGNNRLNEKLVSGTHNLGTRNQCFKKGRLVGLSLPYDVSYSLPYQPIDNTKIYCEDTIVLPNDYDITTSFLPQKDEPKGVSVFDDYLNLKK